MKSIASIESTGLAAPLSSATQEKSKIKKAAMNGRLLRRYKLKRRVRAAAW
jgi:hypothetical protein